MDNRLFCPVYTDDGEKLTVSVALQPYESRFLIVLPDEAAVKNLPLQKQVSYLKQPVLTLAQDGWSISTSKAPDVHHFHPQNGLTQLGNATVPGKLPAFTGTIRYEKTFEFKNLPVQKQMLLDLGRVYETAELRINGQFAGAKIAPPYCFQIDPYLHKGTNTICVDVTNTLAKERGRNLLDRDMVQEPSGLIGPVRILCEA